MEHQPGEARPGCGDAAADSRTIRICETIREHRKKRGIRQEILSAALGISVQAVSKWETQSSLPDVALLPRIAAFFGMSMDDLFFGPPEATASLALPFADDGVLRVVQFRGARLLTKDLYSPDVKIPLAIRPDGAEDASPLHVEIWGSADIEGNIYGDVTVGYAANCGDIQGDLSAGYAVNCDDVDGDVSAGYAVNCGGVDGDVAAGTGVNCGDVGGGVSAGGGIECKDIRQGVQSCTGDIHCHDIQGEVHCEGSVYYNKT